MRPGAHARAAAIERIGGALSTASRLRRSSTTPPASVLCRMSGERIFSATGKPIASAAAAASAAVATVAALGQRDAVARERRVERCRREIARRGRGRHRRLPCRAARMEPERVHRAQRRLEPLQERKARGLLRFHRLRRHLVAHAAEADDRLVGAAAPWPAAPRRPPRRRPCSAAWRPRRSCRRWGPCATTSQTPAACLSPIGMPRSSGFLGSMPSCMNGIRSLSVCGGVVRHHRAFGLGVVVEQIDGAARGGDEADARALRQPPAVEGERASPACRRASGN